jgi:Flp pilus assembly pilin Flp
MLATSPYVKRKPGEHVTLAVQKMKVMLRNFNNDQEGMNTVEAIILLFVAAVVLVAFFIFIWPLVREGVMDAIKSLFTEEGDRQKQ